MSIHPDSVGTPKNRSDLIANLLLALEPVLVIALAVILFMIANGDRHAT